MKKRTISAKVGWVGIVIYVLAWDLAPRTETLSHGFANGDTIEDRKHHPHGHPFALAIWALITLHLVRALPDRYDPIRIIANQFDYKQGW